MALVLGLLLAAATVAFGRVPAGDEPLRAGLTMTVTATGGLAVTPEGRVLATRRLAPGGAPAQGRVSVLNQTSDPVSVLVRATGPDTDLDESVRVELHAGTARPLRTSLTRLRRWRPLGASLASQRREEVKVRIYIPGSVDHGYQARRAAVTLEFLPKGART